MTPIGFLLYQLLRILFYIVIADVVMSWLVAFGAVNRGNQFVRTVQDFTHAVTEPLLRPIRNVVPPIGGLDITPIVLLFGISFLQYVIVWIGL